MAFQPLSVEDLRIGMYIKIEGSWFSHPFPTNTFKIKTDKELETLRGLRKINLLYDLDRSDPEGQSHEETFDDGSLLGREEVGSEEIPPISDAPISTQDPHPPNVFHPKFEGQLSFQNYQEQLRKVEVEYKEVLREGKAMLQDISAGQSKGIQTAEKMIASLNSLLLDHDSSRALMNLMGSNETGEEFLMHSLNVCTLSILIARELGIKKHEIETIAMGAMFHDIGEMRYSGEMLLKKSASSLGESKAIFRNHPRYGKDMLSSFPNFPFESLRIVYQHHERQNGSGYPLKLLANSISQYAKIVMVADEYDELCNHPDPSKSLTPSESLSHLYTKQQGTLWSDAIVTLIQQLGVYPPGSLVVLSNESIGIVTSVNMNTRLRPIVMVYDQEIPKEQAMFIDLALEENLSIIKAIRPKELTQEIREYLNPRRIISYYPSVSEEALDSADPESVLAQVSG